MNCNVLYGNVDMSEGGRDGWVSGTSAHIMPMYVFLLKKKLIALIYTCSDCAHIITKNKISFLTCNDNHLT